MAAANGGFSSEDDNAYVERFFQYEGMPPRKRARKSRRSSKKETHHDQFCTDSKLWFPKAPDVVVRLANKEVSSTENDLRSRTQGRLFRLIRQKVLEHNWEDAALLMRGLTGQVIEPRYLPGKFIWEVGNEIIYNHPCLKSEPNIVRDHKDAARNLSATDVCQARVLYEYGLWMLRLGDFQEAREVFRSFHANGVKTTFTVDHQIHKNMMATWLPIFEAYLGLIDWISWKEMKDEERMDDDELDSSPRDLKAEQAIVHFETAFKSPGIWDIFVVKYVEIMEYYSRIDDAEEALREYAVKNRENPNAHKYWYEFLTRHLDTMDNKNNRIQALSNLHEIAPSEYYMLDLHHLRMERAFSVKSINDDLFLQMAIMAVGIIMDMLDFDRWKNGVEPWVNFAASLKKLKSVMDKSDFESMIENVWVKSMRMTWWPQYHFSALDARNSVKIDISFATAKKRIARTLLGSKCEFNRTLQQCLDEVNSD